MVLCIMIKPVTMETSTEKDECKGESLSKSTMSHSSSIHFKICNKQNNLENGCNFITISYHSYAIDYNILLLKCMERERKREAG